VQLHAQVDSKPGAKVGHSLVGRRRVAAAVGHEKVSAAVSHRTLICASCSAEHSISILKKYHMQTLRATSLPVDEQNLRIANALCVSGSVSGTKWCAQRDQAARRLHSPVPFLQGSKKLQAHLLAQDLPGLGALGSRQLVLQVRRLRGAEDGAGGVLHGQQRACGAGSASNSANKAADCAHRRADRRRHAAGRQCMLAVLLAFAWRMHEAAQ
jgi:hypothetical protein